MAAIGGWAGKNYAGLHEIKFRIHITIMFACLSEYSYCNLMRFWESERECREGAGAAIETEAALMERGPCLAGLCLHSLAFDVM